MRMQPNARRTAVIIIILSIIILSVFSECTKKTDIVKIGAILPLTGEAAFYGESVKNGMNFATEYINDHRGIHGSQISIIYEDSRGLPAEGVSAFKKLTAISDVKTIIGDAVSSVTLAFAPLAEKQKIVVISPLSSAPAITDAGDYIFRNVPSDLVNGTTAADYLITDLHLSNLGILYINNDFGIGLRDAFSHRAEIMGENIVVSESYEPGSTDFRSQLAKISSAKPSAIFLIGYSELAQALIQVKEIGLEATLISTGLLEDPNLIKIAGNAAEGVYFTQLGYDPGSNDTTISRFIDSYKNKFGEEPNIIAAYGYDALSVLAIAMNDSDLSPEGIKMQLYAIKNYRGVTGEITFDSNGDVIQPMGIKVIRDGQFVWIKRPSQSE